MSDALERLRRLRVWQDEPMLREVVERWEHEPAAFMGFAQASLDFGMLVGILTRREEQRDLGTSNTVELSDELQDYAAKIQFLVDDLDRRGLLEAGTFTFPDGDTWKAGKGREGAAPFVCKFCGAPSWVDPSDQRAPADYCHAADHGQ